MFSLEEKFTKFSLQTDEHGECHEVVNRKEADIS